MELPLDVAWFVQSHESVDRVVVEGGEIVCDPVHLAVFSHRFMGIAEQMGRTLQRTSVSVNIKVRWLGVAWRWFGSLALRVTKSRKQHKRNTQRERTNYNTAPPNQPRPGVGFDSVSVCDNKLAAIAIHPLLSTGASRLLLCDVRA